MERRHLDEENTHIHRRHFLRTVGLVGAATVGLTALNPTDALAFTTKELEEKLHEVGINGNIAIGSTFAKLTTGSKSTALGVGAMTALTTGTENTALGYGALEKNTSAAQNTAIGYGALQAATTGYANVAVGKEALANTTIG